MSDTIVKNEDNKLGAFAVSNVNFRKIALLTRQLGIFLHSPPRVHSFECSDRGNSWKSTDTRGSADTSVRVRPRVGSFAWISRRIKESCSSCVSPCVSKVVINRAFYSQLSSRINPCQSRIGIVPRRSDDDWWWWRDWFVTSEPLRMAPVAIPSSFGETRQRLSRNTCPDACARKGESRKMREGKQDSRKMDTSLDLVCTD